MSHELLHIFRRRQANLRVAGPDACAAELVFEHLHQPAPGIDNLWVKCRRSLHDRALRAGEEQECLQYSAELVLAALPAHHDGDNPAESVVNRVQDGVGDFGLIGIERLADDIGGETFDGGHGLIVHSSMVALNEKR